MTIFSGRFNNNVVKVPNSALYRNRGLFRFLFRFCSALFRF